MKIEDYLKESQHAVERRLDEIFSGTLPSEKLQESMKYSLFAGGKRIRPALAFAACEALGTGKDAALPVACALEMIHTYSLIHDDLPAMDNDSLRRGKPTNHVVYGEGIAILAGDGLLTEAFHILCDPSWNISDAQRIDIIGIIAEGAGTHGMVSGQALDLEWEGKDFDETTLELIHENKTGKLLRAAILAGGRAGGAQGKDFENLNTYGKSIGLAFQIADDLLDVTRTSKELGKSSGSDAKNHKATYPSLLGIEESRKRASALLEHALASVSGFGDRAGALCDLARFIIERKN